MLAKNLSSQRKFSTLRRHNPGFSGSGTVFETPQAAGISKKAACGQRRGKAGR